MKNKLIETVALILGLLTTLAGVLALPQVAMLPAEWQPYVALALALVVVGKNGAYVILDWHDDGKLNKSYKVGLFLLAGFCLLSLPSCEALAKKTGMSPVDLFRITSGAAVRLQNEAERLKAEIKAAKEAEAERLAELEVTAAKNPQDVQP
jgi:hypothetical protein